MALSAQAWEQNQAERHWSQTSVTLELLQVQHLCEIVSEGLENG